MELSATTTGASNAAQANSLLSFATTVSNDIKDAMSSKSKRKVNHTNYIKKRVKRLNTVTVAKPASALKPKKLAAGKQRGPELGPSNTSAAFRASLMPSHLLAPHSRSTSLPSLSQQSQPAAYHGLHRRSLPTAQLEASNHTLYAPPAHAQKFIDSDPYLEKVLDDLESLDSPPSQLSSRHDSVSSSTYGHQAYLGEYPLTGSPPYSECSDDLYESRSAVCSPSSSAFSRTNSPPMAPAATSSTAVCWAPLGSSQTVYTMSAPGGDQGFEGVASSCNSWLPTVAPCLPVSLPPIAVLPCPGYGYDQSLPLTPTIFELYNSLACGDNF